MQNPIVILKFSRNVSFSAFEALILRRLWYTHVIYYLVEHITWLYVDHTLDNDYHTLCQKKLVIKT